MVERVLCFKKMVFTKRLLHKIVKRNLDPRGEAGQRQVLGQAPDQLGW